MVNKRQLSLVEGVAYYWENKSFANEVDDVCEFLSTIHRDIFDQFNANLIPQIRNAAGGRVGLDSARKTISAEYEGIDESLLINLRTLEQKVNKVILRMKTDF